MQAAREDVQQVLDNLADSRAAAGVEVVQPILDVKVAELLERVRAVARSVVEDGGRAYVGSNSEPRVALDRRLELARELDGRPLPALEAAHRPGGVARPGSWGHGGGCHASGT